jgi:radical SAM superfamily enzyme YgiQ (UPF0313 family)
VNAWALKNQIRRQVSEEQGVLRRQAPFKIALCYPSSYSVGMSSLGFQTIYREICSHDGACAERAFLPSSPQEYRRHRVPVFTYESETPLADFPVLAFSIAYELELTGFFEVMRLSGIPLLRQDRSHKHPLIIFGGPLTNSNPAPLAPFADLIILGEGEELIHKFVHDAVEMGRDDLLAGLADCRGCYAPGMTASFPQIAMARDDLLPAYSQIITKNSVLPSMFLVEPERGCSRECAYCVMRRSTNGGMRLVSPEKVLSLIPENARRVGLVGAAVTDHPQISELVRKIVASGREIGISSLRADRLDQDLVQSLAQGGYRTLTIASDGASQRLRRLLGRKTSERHLIHAAELARDAGMQRVKLYEMIGFPGETRDDIDELMRFAIEISRIAPLSLSISPFVAKRNTPLDGSPFEPIASLEEKLSIIRSRLKRHVEVLPSSARWAWIEYKLAQGGEQTGLAARDAWLAGGSFSSWKRALEGNEAETSCHQAAVNGVGESQN